MTLQECTALLAPIVVAFRAEFDDPTFRAYHRVLKDVPAALLDAAVDELVQSGARFMPTAPELLTATERTRRRLLALHPYDGCAECEGHIGWREIVAGNGQPMVDRCPCKGRWQQRLTGIGLIEPLAQLPGEAAHESEPVYPTVADLPAPLRRQLTALAERKGL